MIDLRWYQIEKAAKIATLLRTVGVAYSAMETRTGKTITAFEACRLIGAKRVLFLTKKKVVPSAERDHICAGYADHFAVLVTNYEQLTSDKARSFWPDVLVLDEAHRLGGFPKPCVAALDLRQKYARVPTILLSATPCPESWSQIYHQLWCTKWDVFSEQKFYDWVRSGYVRPKERYIGQQKIMDYSDANIKAVMERVNPILVTCTQKEAGIEHAVSERTLRVPVSPYVDHLFNELKNHRIFEIGDMTCTGDTAAKMMSKGHQLMSGTVIMDDTTHRIVDRSKAIMIRKDAAQHWYKKIAIYHKYKAEKEVIEKVFEGDCTSSWTEFQKKTGPRVFVSQLQSGREGIRLDRADAIYIYNIDFAWLSYSQTRERSTSHERKTPPELVWVMAAYPDGNGLEDRIHRVVMGKRKYTTAFFRRDYL